MKVLMLYASMTGNTEIMAETMMDELNQFDIQLDVKLFEDNEIKVTDLPHYDLVFIGVYTWVEGDVPPEVEDFFDHLIKIDLSGIVFGVFGAADSDYPDFGTAVTMMDEQLYKLGGVMVPHPIIVDDGPSETDFIRCKEMVTTALSIKKKLD